MAKEIYVGHISENATEEDVWKLFSVMGTVTSVHLIINPETGEFKRCGYVRMLSGVDLNEVVEALDGAYLIDREITVSIARPQKPGMSKSGGNKQPWMKSGSRSAVAPTSKPALKKGNRPSSRPETKTETHLEQRQNKLSNVTRSKSSSGSQSDSLVKHGKSQRTGRNPLRPRKSK